MVSTTAIAGLIAADPGVDVWLSLSFQFMFAVRQNHDVVRDHLWTRPYPCFRGAHVQSALWIGGSYGLGKGLGRGIVSIYTPEG